MRFQPKTAEPALEQEQNDADQQRIAGAGVLIQAQGEAVINKGAQNGLHDVTAEAHASKRY